MIPSDLPTLARLQACLNTEFALADAASQAGSAIPTLTLVEATALDPALPGERHFSLLFRGPAQPLLPHASHTLEHADLGSFAIFLVLLKRNPDYAYYQAVFD